MMLKYCWNEHVVLWVLVSSGGHGRIGRIVEILVGRNREFQQGAAASIAFAPAAVAGDRGRDIVPPLAFRFITRTPRASTSTPVVSRTFHLFPHHTCAQGRPASDHERVAIRSNVFFPRLRFLDHSESVDGQLSGKAAVLWRFGVVSRYNLRFELVFQMNLEAIAMGRPGHDMLVSLERGILNDLVYFERELKLQPRGGAKEGARKKIG